MDVWDEEYLYMDEQAKELKQCYYCGNDRQDEIVQCMNKGCYQYFCNNAIYDNDSSHIIFHLQYRSHNQISYIPSQDCEGEEIVCYNCGNNNIFTLIFKFDENSYDESSLTIICRNVCLNSNPRYREYEWSPVIIDQAINPNLLGSSIEYKIVTEEDIKLLEYNLSNGLIKNTSSIGPENIKKIKLKYDTVEEYKETFELLLELDNAYEAEEEQKIAEREIFPEWSSDFKSFTFYLIEENFHLKVNDELEIKSTGVSMQGIIKKINSSQEILVQIKSNRTGNETLTRVVIKPVRKNVAYDRMVRALKAFRGIEDKFRNYILGYDVELPAHYVEPREDYSVRGLPPLNESQNKAIRSALDSPFCLIQGPPGTGKTVTTASIVYHLSNSINRPSQYRQVSLDLEKKKKKIIKRFELVLKMNEELEFRKQLLETMIKSQQSNPNIDSKIEIFQSIIKNWENKMSEIEIEKEKILNDIEVLQFKLNNLQDDTERRRILVTAPSNIAVDHLVSKIKETGLKVVRFYSKSKEEVNNDLSRCSYHALFENELKKPENRVIRELFESKKKGGLNLKSEKSAYSAEERRIRDEILKEVHVICCTCIGALDHRLQYLRFSKVIIDEACQSREPESLIPLLFKPDQVIMVGDHYQLGPVIKCKQAEDVGLGNSLFQRMIDLGRPAHMLQFQYRMHPLISDFPCKVFYDGLLKDGIKASDRYHEKCNLDWPSGKPVFFYHVESPEEISSSGKSYLNRKEAEIVVKLVNQIGIEADIGVITFYDAQRVTILNYLKDKNLPKLEVASVDSFQGREKDYIILSCVRSSNKGGVGFLGNYRRLNVAITRAKYGLIICGNVDTLLRSPIWKTLLGYYKEKDLVYEECYGSLVRFNAFNVGRPGFNLFHQKFPYLDAAAYDQPGKEAGHIREDGDEYEEVGWESVN